MRILVFSDSHGNSHRIREAILSNPTADTVIHLGDGERDLDELQPILGGKRLVCVCGNCDYGSMLRDNETLNIGSVRILCTHGHREGVKYGTDSLIDKAKRLGARIVLYGHTHEPVTDYDDGLYVMNPGSIREGCYGAIDITAAGIVCLNLNV